MAVYFLHLKNFGRAGGSSAVSAAAYRAGERIRDERTGKTYDHAARQDVMHKEILLPAPFAHSQMNWAMDRAQLWNAAERAESRSNARVAREYLVALPVELSAEQRLLLARGFSQELCDRYRFALDLTIHAPRDFPDSDPRNFHAHLLATTREVGSEGLTAKTSLEWNDAKRREAGLGHVVQELLYVRERWATVTNEALHAAHVAARIDHRTLRAQGIDREPTPHIPRAAFEMERHGYRSFVAERVRAQHQLRVAARLDARSQHPAASAEQAVAPMDVAGQRPAEFPVQPAAAMAVPSQRLPVSAEQPAAAMTVAAQRPVASAVQSAAPIAVATQRSAGSTELSTAPMEVAAKHPVASAQMPAAPMGGDRERSGTAGRRPSLEDVRRQARETWLRKRHESAYDYAEPAAAKSAASVRQPVRDDDLSR